MKATGIVRRVDTDNDQIILRKHKLACVFCKSRDEVTKIKGKNVCKDCFSAISQKAV